MHNTSFYKSEIGTIKIVDDGKCIKEIRLLRDFEGISKHSTEISKKAFEEVTEYLKGRRKSFSVNLEPDGTEFQKKVWNELINVPYGEVRTYKDIAKAIGNEKAVRAVGGANNKNPILIAIPCHRIIGSNGKLVGYAAGIDIKEKLLNLEGENK